MELVDLIDKEMNPTDKDKLTGAVHKLDKLINLYYQQYKKPMQLYIAGRQFTSSMTSIGLDVLQLVEYAKAKTGNVDVLLSASGRHYLFPIEFREACLSAVLTIEDKPLKPTDSKKGFLARLKKLHGG